MPSSSKSAGFNSRAVISSWLYASAIQTPSLRGDGAEHILRGRDRIEGEAMPYELPPLPYEYGALEPTIDEQTMRLHHDKHHQAYVDNLNKAVEGTEWDGRPIEQLLGSLIDILPEDRQTAVRNNGGGHANHTFFWQIMKPGGGGEPTGALADAINDTFDGLEQLKTAINDA